MVIVFDHFAVNKGVGKVDDLLQRGGFPSVDHRWIMVKKNRVFLSVSVDLCLRKAIGEKKENSRKAAKPKQN